MLEICLATIGVCVFGALTSVGALFYFINFLEFFMFNNIGEKIKSLAVGCTIIGCVSSMITGIILLTNENGIGVLVFILGCLVSWVGSFVLYGFGELITQTTAIAKGSQRMQLLAVANDSKKSVGIKKETIEEIQNEVVSDYETEKNGGIKDFDPANIAKRNECPSCFHKITVNDKECSYCGYKLK